MRVNFFREEADLLKASGSSRALLDGRRLGQCLFDLFGCFNFLFRFFF
jgi:hypothetical protein